MEDDIKITYPIAKNHQLIQIAPQFRVIKRGRRKQGVEREYVSQDGKKKVRIQMWKELDIADQDLLLTILAIALPVDRGRVLKKEENENYKKLWEDLKLKGILADFDTLCIKTNIYELLKEMNKKANKNTYTWVKESLDRLAGTRFYIETERYVYNSNLISYIIDKKTKEIEIALNPLNALVLMNDKNGYILHNRKERILLKSEVSKALHSVLVGLVNPKSTKTVKIDILIEKIYLEKIEEMSNQQRKDARRAVKKAVEKLNGLKNWKLTLFDNNTVKIERF